jgi:hypothetical protein
MERIDWLKKQIEKNIKDRINAMSNKEYWIKEIESYKKASETITNYCEKKDAEAHVRFLWHCYERADRVAEDCQKDIAKYKKELEKITFKSLRKRLFFLKESRVHFGHTDSKMRVFVSRQRPLRTTSCDIPCRPAQLEGKSS